MATGNVVDIRTVDYFVRYKKFKKEYLPFSGQSNLKQDLCISGKNVVYHNSVSCKLFARVLVNDDFVDCTGVAKQ